MRHLHLVSLLNPQIALQLSEETKTRKTINVTDVTRWRGGSGAGFGPLLFPLLLGAGNGPPSPGPELARGSGSQGGYGTHWADGLVLDPTPRGKLGIISGRRQVWS